MADANVGDRFATDLARIEEGEVRAHLSQCGEQAGAGGVEANIRHHHVRAGDEARRDHREGGGGGIAGDGDMLRTELSLAAERDDARAVRSLLDGEVGAEAAQHPLAMVARRHGLDHAGEAGRVEAGEQHRRLDLRGGDGKAISDRHRGAEAAHHQRQAIARRGGDR